jgi:hypothetical protein
MSQRILALPEPPARSPTRTGARACWGEWSPASLMRPGANPFEPPGRASLAPMRRLCGCRWLTSSGGWRGRAWSGVGRSVISIGLELAHGHDPRLLLTVEAHDAGAGGVRVKEGGLAPADPDHLPARKLQLSPQHVPSHSRPGRGRVNERSHVRELRQRKRRTPAEMRAAIVPSDDSKPCTGPVLALSCCHWGGAGADCRRRAERRHARGGGARGWSG